MMKGATFVAMSGPSLTVVAERLTAAGLAASSWAGLGSGPWGTEASVYTLLGGMERMTWSAREMFVGLLREYRQESAYVQDADGPALLRSDSGALVDIGEPADSLSDADGRVRGAA